MAQLLSNLPIGAKVKFGKYSVNGEAAEPIVWLVVAKNHNSTPAYPTNSVTLLTERIIDLRCIDAAEGGNADSQRKTSGNNRYSLSNLDQWLNKDSGSGRWYTAQHSADQAPTEDKVFGGVTEYGVRPGFLNAFSEDEKNAIKSTTIRVAKTSVDGSGYEDISRKVFLASATEVGVIVENSSNEGAMWSYFGAYPRTTALTQQAFKNTLTGAKPSSISDMWYWWIRTPSVTVPQQTNSIKPSGEIVANSSYNGNWGVRPALNLSSTFAVTDNTDSDGCYTATWNTTPTSPSIINVPTIYGGKSNSISWTQSTDLEGDTITYTLECSVNGGTYVKIYSGTSTTYAHLVPFGTTSVAYRVKATDSLDESSAYTASATKTVINNNAPVISGSDANLGVKSSGFTGTYTVTDANNNAVTVTESIDGIQIRSLVATLGQTITYGITGTTWLGLANGSHTLTIRATDGIDTSVRTYTFTKLVNSFKIQNATPWVSATEPSKMPSRIMLVVTRNLPAEATFKVEVCNNGYDASPKWEDATDAVKSGLVHVFTNKTKTASDWGVLVRVTVERNGATGACYISAIGGNFE